MIFIIATFVLSLLLIAGVFILKVREVESGDRSQILRMVAMKLDPFFGRLVSFGKFFSEEFVSDIFRFFAAKLGLWAARMLILIRNFSSKLAAHLYHTSRKAESGDPLASHPSFFIKAILEFREKMKEEKEDKENK